MEDYRWIATSPTGFVQQVTANYVCRGYYFFVQGIVPAGKSPTAIDAKLMDKFGVAMTRKERYRRKRKGLSNVHYIRFDRHWLLLISHGDHEIWELEKENIRDAREVPIHFLGYSIRLRRGLYKPVRCRVDRAVAERDDKLRVRVQVGRKAFAELKAEFVQCAKRLPPGVLAGMFWNQPYEPYAPVRQQLLELLRVVNKQLKSRGEQKLPTTVIRYRRAIVKPFGEAEQAA